MPDLRQALRAPCAWSAVTGRGATATFKDDRSFHNRGDRHPSGGCRGDGRCESLRVRLVEKDREDSRRVYDHLGRPPLVVQETTVLDGGRAVAQPAGGAFSDSEKSPNASLGTELAPLARQALPECHRNRAGHGFTGKLRQVPGEPTRLFVLDVDAHRSLLVQVDISHLSLPFGPMPRVGYQSAQGPSQSSTMPNCPRTARTLATFRDCVGEAPCRRAQTHRSSSEAR